MSEERIPPLFLSHGSPSLALEKEDPSFLFFQQLGKDLAKEYSIKAIVVFSAHWITDGAVKVTTNPSPTQVLALLPLLHSQ